MGYFIRSLLERKVIQSLAIFIAVMWVFLQVVDVAQEPLGLPIWVSRTLIIATLIGTPVVAIISWFYDFSGTQLIKAEAEGNPEVNTRAITSLGLVTLVVIGISVAISRNWGNTSSNLDDEIASLAVLPFEIDPSATQSHFRFLAGDIINSLQRNPGVRLISADELETVSLQQQSSQITEQLDIRYLISGDINAIDNEITISVAITDTLDESIVWEESFLGAELAAVNQLVANAVINQFELEDQIATNFTNNARAYDLYLRGQQEFAIDAYSESGLDYMHSAIEEDARFALPLTALCNYYLRMYDIERNTSHFEEAERSCYRSLTLVSKAPEVHYALGNLYTTSGQPERAIEEYRQVLAINPEHYNAQYQLARTLGDSEDGYEEAERLLIALTQRHPGSPGAYSSLQNLYFTLGRYEEALGPASMAIRLRPLNEDFKFSYSGLLMLSGRFTEAKEFILETLASNPEDRAGFESNLATAYFFDEDFSEAAELYRIAASSVPNDDRILANLGDALWHAEGPAAAREVFEQVLELARANLEINPSNTDHLQSIIIAAGSLGDRDLVESSIQATIEAAPQNPQNLYRIAVAYRRLGDSDFAEQFANRAIEMGYPQILVEFDADLKGLFQ